jgi:hypothetical protein
MNISPLLYKGLRDDFDIQELSFRIHDGAKQYLDRHEPTLFERYAELIGVSFSILLALASGLFTLSKIREQKKKDHIDEYYHKLLQIRREIPSVNSKKQGEEVLSQIRELQERTMQLVIEEKLLANESFTIFLNLSNILSEEVKEKINNVD